MPIGVVDGVEACHVNKKQCQRVMVALGTHQALRQPVKKQASIRQGRQRVKVRQSHQFPPRPGDHECSAADQCQQQQEQGHAADDGALPFGIKGCGQLR